MDEESKKFHEETFEPVGVTPPEDSTPVETPKVETKTEVSTEDSAEDTPEVDNDTVRYEYWQSEANKAQNAMQKMHQELETLRQKPQTQADEMPPEPVGDDPNEWLAYNAKMNKYNAKLITELRTERQKEIQQKQQYEAEMNARNTVVNKLTEVTKNPQKAQKILGFFANTQNLQDPALYNVMYDAAQAYLNKSSKAKPNLAPPPPIDGGESVQRKETPDDAFNQQLGGNSKYRL